MNLKPPWMLEFDVNFAKFNILYHNKYEAITNNSSAIIQYISCFVYSKIKNFSCFVYTLYK